MRAKINIEWLVFKERVDKIGKQNKGSSIGRRCDWRSRKRRLRWCNEWVKKLITIAGVKIGRKRRNGREINSIATTEINWSKRFSFRSIQESDCLIRWPLYSVHWHSRSLQQKNSEPTTLLQMWSQIIIRSSNNLKDIEYGQ